ncbi:MAG: zinc ribbon domain-containing protein [Christensenellaceae bacterium]
MDRLKELLEYQEKDLALDAFKAKVKDTPTRKRLVQLQRYLKSSQKKISDAEKQAILKQEAVRRLENQTKQVQGELDELMRDMGYFAEAEAEELKKNEVQQLGKTASGLDATAANIKKELLSIVKEIEESDTAIRELLQKMRVAKKEYDTLRETYDAEMQEVSGEITEMEASVAAIGKEIEPTLLEEYKRIKGIRSNPVAVLEENRCTGCNMQLPSGVAGRVVSSDSPVLCENCGRILVVL